MSTTQSVSSYLDRILIAPQLSYEGGFCGVCRLVHEKMKNDFFFVDKRPESVAYAIASNVLDFYYDKRTKPITKRQMADRIGKKSIGMYSETSKGSKDRYHQLQIRIRDLLVKMKNSKPLDFN